MDRREFLERMGLLCLVAVPVVRKIFPVKLWQSYDPLGDLQYYRKKLFAKEMAKSLARMHEGLASWGVESPFET